MFLFGKNKEKELMFLEGERRQPMTSALVGFKYRFN